MSDKSTGKVVDKYYAQPLVPGSPPAYVLVVEEDLPLGDARRVYFTCDHAVYEHIWKEARIEWGTRRVLRILTNTPRDALPCEWRELHPDVQFVPSGSFRAGGDLG